MSPACVLDVSVMRQTLLCFAPMRTFIFLPSIRGLYSISPSPFPLRHVCKSIIHMNVHIHTSNKFNNANRSAKAKNRLGIRVQSDSSWFFCLSLYLFSYLSIFSPFFFLVTGMSATSFLASSFEIVHFILLLLRFSQRNEFDLLALSRSQNICL